MKKYLCALAVLSLSPAAANAELVNINYNSQLIFPAGRTISGFLEFDASDSRLTAVRDLGAAIVSTYDSPTFKTTYNLFGSTFSGAFSFQVVEYRSSGLEYYFYTNVPNTDLNLNLRLIFSSTQSMNTLALRGYENADFAEVLLIDPFFNQIRALGSATYSVSYVPEPASWAMMIAGVGLAGGALRRRRSVRTTVSFA